ncbi:MAG: hypothetical protein HUU49_01560 [Candidatus Buchananbacteria bacterium]|nr:hypothetical protein [Candidatus Buchananbacteria bacterium]
MTEENSLQKFIKDLKEQRAALLNGYADNQSLEKLSENFDKIITTDENN